MTAAETGGVPVPSIVANTTWDERPALLLTWSPGQPLAAALRGDPDNLPRARSLGNEFGRVQAAIHALAPPAELPDRSTIGESSLPESALVACLAATPSHPPALLHLDYHPLNVLVEDERVTAVLDWANARGGDPRFDLARTFSILRLAPLPPSLPEQSARTMRRAFETGWRRGYEQAAGPIGDLTPFCWWAGTLMERDLAPRVGRPDIPWLTPAYLARVRRWTGGWRARATHS
jgi:aminoglycoside phosphotransferase (APT) family kinase protein